MAGFKSLKNSAYRRPLYLSPCGRIVAPISKLDGVVPLVANPDLLKVNYFAQPNFKTDNFAQRNWPKIP